MALLRVMWVLLGGTLLACHGETRKTEKPRRHTPTTVSSNILRADYAGSTSCQSCHPRIFAQWHASPMHKMTRQAEQADIRGPFQDGVFRFKDDTVRLSQEGSQRFLRIESPRFGDHLFRITKVIGGHHREDYAGVEITNGIARPSEGQRILPISYMLSTGTMRYKGYSVMSPERPGLRPGTVWERTCILCHNTAPYFVSLFGALAGPGTPPYQGEVVDPLLPEGKRQTLVITDETKLRTALSEELSVLRGHPISVPPEQPTRELLKHAVKTTRAFLSESHLREVGIGCESCHGGSAAHVKDPDTHPSYAPTSEFLRTEPPQSRAQQINRVCARCHQVLFSRYPFTWEGGLRAHNPGGSNINSGEGRDLLLGGCQSELSCVKCHDPHAPSNDQRSLELETKKGDEVCTSCHQKYATLPAQRAHSHHDPQGEGGRCMACHMPRKNMSLEGKLSRYHRIGSPTDSARVLGDRPLECALCHPDRSVEQLTKEMEQMFGKTYDRGALLTLYQDLSQNVLLQTLKIGKPHEQASAIAVLGQHKRRDAIPLLAQLVTHPLPILRYYVRDALANIVGSPDPFDLHTDNDKLQAATADWLRHAGITSGAPSASTPKPTKPEAASDEE